jgi:hypothetical protein
MLLPIQDVSAGELTNHLAMGAAGMFPIGSESNPCADNWLDCYNWVVFPGSDPMVFWPPPSSIEKFSIPFSSTPLERALSLNITTPLSNTLTIVQGLRVGSTVNYDVETFFQSAVLVINNFCGVTGLPISDTNQKSGVLDSFASGDLELQRKSSSSYLFSIPVNQLNFVEDIASLCRYSDFTKVETLVIEDLDAILNASFIVEVQPHRVRSEFLICVVLSFCFVLNH